MPKPTKTEVTKPKPKDIAAVAIARSPGQDHLGCYYVAEDKSMRQVHLAGHLRLKDEPVDEQFLSWVVPCYPSVLLEQVAAIARRFVKLRPKGKVPYGFDQPFLAVQRSGELKEDLLGLTCASLVVGLFDTSQAPIIDPEGWVNDKGDLEWQTAVTRQLQRHYPDHARELLGQNGATRFRPIHVFGGACCDSPPARKPMCVEQIRILSRLECLWSVQRHILCAAVLFPGALIWEHSK